MSSNLNRDIVSFFFSLISFPGKKVCTFTVISDECMTAALLASGSEVLVFQGCRLQPSFRNAEQVGAAQPCCHLVNCQFPPPHWVPPCAAGRKNACSCSKFRVCNARSRKWDWQTVVMDCTWNLWDLTWCSCVIRNPENGIFEGELMLLLPLASWSSSRCVSVPSAFFPIVCCPFYLAGQWWWAMDVPGVW